MGFAKNYERAKPFLAVIFMQFGYAGMSIISKFALNEGMSQHVLVVYRHAIATIVIAPFAFIFDRKVRPKMTVSIFIKITLLGLLEPTLDQNLYYTGMKYTTATFATAMCNVLPAFAFLMAWAFRLENIKIKEMHSQAKILGTVVTVGGAMLMTLLQGPELDLPWANGSVVQQISGSGSVVIKQDPVKGALLMTIGCICWASFIILQAMTLKEYPAELSLTVLICLMGTMEGSLLAAIMEKGNPSAWIIGWDYKLLASVYSGVISSGVAYYIQGVIMKTKGPVFVTAFSPLSMILVTILGSIILSEILFLGRVLGAIVIVIGLYLVLWGKSKDQSPSDCTTTNEKMIPTTTNTTQICTTNDETIARENCNFVSDSNFVTLDVTRVRRPTVESN